ncbi:hypothetical protein [Bacteriophage Phobos]|uniref:Type II toxin-antitoxin system HicA family toxin n=1 Tax=Bacteriophage Phobos TaxID=2662138 RepID=A0A5Q2U9V7_9CAUD|nr:hypothetical protein JT319_gp43 [Bacteriophage Phobos]QGH45013.1 hypothetical protein [Bacteriophage Phobos]WPK42409.1 hypothetical protein [Pseudomonas phage Ppu-503]
MAKSQKDLIKYAASLGFTHEFTTKHIRFVKDGHPPVVASKTPNCPHAFKNAQADLRRANRSTAA